MIRVAICDDEPVMTGKIEELLLVCSEECNKKLDISVFFDGSTLVSHIEQQNDYQLIYLDIEMKQMGGVDVGKNLRKHNNQALIIYVSSHENYAKDLFEVDAFRFLSKPIDERKFKNYFLQAMDKLSSSDESYEFMYKRKKFRIAVGDILYFESAKRIITIYTNDKIYSFYGKLNEVEGYFQKSEMNFLRIHQSYLVNYRYVEVIGYDYIELKSGERLQISEDRQKKIKSEYCNLISSEVSDF